MEWSADGAEEQEVEDVIWMDGRMVVFADVDDWCEVC